MATRRGRTKAPENTKTVTLLLDSDTFNEYRSLCVRKGSSVSFEVRRFIDKELKKDAKRAEKEAKAKAELSAPSSIEEELNQFETDIGSIDLELHPTEIELNPIDIEIEPFDIDVLKK